MSKVSRNCLKLASVLVLAVFLGGVITTLVQRYYANTVLIPDVIEPEVKMLTTNITVKINVPKNTSETKIAKKEAITPKIVTVTEASKETKRCKRRRKKHRCHNHSTMSYSTKHFGVGPVDPHVEYVNVVLALSCDDFWQIMWNPANEIWQQMMIREEIRDYTILSGNSKSEAKINLMRKMHAPMGPDEAPQHITLTTDFDKKNDFETRQLYTVTDDMPVSDKFNVCERWDAKPVGENYCQVRMSGRADWKVNWHILMGLINGLVSQSFNKLKTNFIDEMTNQGLLVENLLKK